MTRAQRRINCERRNFIRIKEEKYSQCSFRCPLYTSLLSGWHLLCTFSRLHVRISMVFSFMKGYPMSFRMKKDCLVKLERGYPFISASSCRMSSLDSRVKKKTTPSFLYIVILAVVKLLAWSAFFDWNWVIDKNIYRL